MLVLSFLAAACLHAVVILLLLPRAAAFPTDAPAGEHTIPVDFASAAVENPTEQPVETSTLAGGAAAESVAPAAGAASPPPPPPRQTAALPTETPLPATPRPTAPKPDAPEPAAPETPRVAAPEKPETSSPEPPTPPEPEPARTPGPIVLSSVAPQAPDPVYAPAPRPAVLPAISAVTAVALPPPRTLPPIPQLEPLPDLSQAARSAGDGGDGAASTARGRSSRANLGGAGATGVENDLNRWNGTLYAALGRRARCPPGVRTSGRAFTTLRITLLQSGRILASTVVESSGDPALDRMALLMAAPGVQVPPAPPSQPPQFTVVVPFGFSC